MSVVVITAEGIEVEMLPELGGKISGLLDVERGRQWLVPTPKGTRGAPGQGVRSSRPE